MLYTYIERCASDKLATVNKMQTLYWNLRGRHFVRIQAAARGVNKPSLLWGVTQILLVIGSF
jgi:hypothetical protein